jgi:uncharacterized protein
METSVTMQQDRTFIQALARIPPLSEHDMLGIRTALTRIVDIADPLQVLLFGSRARGGARPWSDVDLLVILPDAADRRALWVRMSEAVSDIVPAIDIVPTSQSGYAERSQFPFFVERYAQTEGVVMYER